MTVTTKEEFLNQAPADWFDKMITVLAEEERKEYKRQKPAGHKHLMVMSTHVLLLATHRTRLSQAIREALSSPPEQATPRMVVRHVFNQVLACVKQIQAGLTPDAAEEWGRAKDCLISLDESVLRKWQTLLPAGLATVRERTPQLLQEMAKRLCEIAWQVIYERDPARVTSNLFWDVCQHALSRLAETSMTSSSRVMEALTAYVHYSSKLSPSWHDGAYAAFIDVLDAQRDAIIAAWEATGYFKAEDDGYGPSI